MGGTGVGRVDRLDPVDPFQALGDANRQRIVELLADEPRSVGALAAAMPISRPAISRHLRLLKDAGLVAVTPDGTRRIYQLDDQGVEVVEAWLRRMWGDALARFRLVADNTTPSGAHPAAADPTVADPTVGREHDLGRDDDPARAP